MNVLVTTDDNLLEIATNAVEETVHHRPGYIPKKKRILGVASQEELDDFEPWILHYKRKRFLREDGIWVWALEPVFFVTPPPSIA